MEELIRKNRKNVLKNGFTFRKMQEHKSLQKGFRLLSRSFISFIEYAQVL